MVMRLQHPIENDSMLNDQPFNTLDYDEEDLITKEEFYNIWNDK
jgi:hypothetical protein